MPEQIFDIPLTNGTSVPAKDIVHSWDLWSFFSQEDVNNQTPITATVVLLGLVIFALFALLNVSLILLFVKLVTKKGLHSLPQDVPNSNTNPTTVVPTEDEGEINNDVHLTINNA